MNIISSFNPKTITEETDECLEVTDVDAAFLMCTKDPD